MNDGRSEAPKDRREYIRVAVDFPTNPKLAELDDEMLPLAGWLALTAWCYCGQNLTDGIFTPNVVYRIAGVSRDVGKELIAIGMWHEAGHECQECPQPKERSIVIHDFLKHQRSREEAEALRSARSQAGAAGAAKRWAGRHAKQDDQAAEMASAMASATADAKASAMANASQADGKAMAEVEGELEQQNLFPTPDGAGGSKRKTLDDHFAEFWSHYPLKKGGKRTGRAAWDKARTRAPIDVILAGVIRFAGDPNLPADRSKLPYPERWLNGDRWADDPYPAVPSPENAVQADGSIDVDAVLGKDRWSLPTPPEHCQPGMPGYAAWAREQWNARNAERAEEARLIIERRKSA